MTRDLFRVGDLFLPRGRASAGLPPGQREISAFPRYGGKLARDPVTPQSPSIEAYGSLAHPVVYTLSYLGALRTRRR